MLSRWSSIWVVIEYEKGAPSLSVMRLSFKEITPKLGSRGNGSNF